MDENKRKIDIHDSETMKKLNELRKVGEECDLKLQVGNRVFPCHRAVLTESAEFFGSMLSGRFKECTEDVIRLNQDEEDAFEMLLNYLYTKEIDLTANNVISLYKMADYYGITDLIRYCRECITAHEFNILSFYEQTYASKLSLVASFVEKIIHDNIVSVANSNHLRLLPYEVFHELISSRPVDIITIAMVIRWVMDDSDGRRHYVKELLKDVRLNYTAFKSTLIDFVPDSQGRRKRKTVHGRCRIHDNKTKRVLKCLQKADVIKFAATVSEMEPGTINIFGVEKGKGNRLGVRSYYYNVEDGSSSFKYVNYLKSPVPVEYFNVTRLQHHIFLFSCHGQLSSFHKLDEMFDQQWLPLRSVGCRFRKMITCWGNGNIYANEMPREPDTEYVFTSPGYEYDRAFNGYSRNLRVGQKRKPRHRFYLSEYVARDDSWGKFYVPYDVSSSDLASDRDVIYIVGGEDSERSFLRVDRRTKKAHALKPLPTLVSNPSTAPTDKKLFVTGGYNKHGDPSNVVQAYDWVADKWMILPSMNHAREDHSLVSFKNRLFAVGGGSSVVETYDPYNKHPWTSSFSTPSYLADPQAII